MKIKEKSLFFAPMEGVTDAYFRKTVQDLYPAWDYLATDFLRIPSAGHYPTKHLVKHFGVDLINNPIHKNKTLYQILATENSHIENVLEHLTELEFKHVDLNLGCPSKTVCKRHGGSFLLSDLKMLKNIIARIRKSYPYFFSAKIRVGFKDDNLFLDIIKLLEDEGVEAITIHGRTREQLYKGIANWSYIAEAKKNSSVPIIGNGDIWNTNDINSIFEQTNCDAVMIARGALKKPWLAQEYYESDTLNTVHEIQKFFQYYDQVLASYNIPDHFRHKRFKGLTRYMFDELKNAEMTKRNLYLSTSKEQYLGIIEDLNT